MYGKEGIEEYDVECTQSGCGFFGHNFSTLES